MKDEFNDGVVLSDKVKQIIKHYDNLEHYQTEQQRRNCVSYDEDNLENILYNESDTVEFTYSAAAGTELFFGEFIEFIPADVDGNGKILANDARQILRFSAQLIKEFEKADK